MPSDTPSDRPVIEFLSFTIEPSQRSEWLEIEETVWSRFLEAQPGFIRKEVWLSADDESEVNAVIWWESMQAWKAIGAEKVAEIDQQMGEWLREPTMRAFQVIRDC